jgi:hypothetical protein
VFASVREARSAASSPRELVAAGLFAPAELVGVLDGLGGAAVLAVGDGAIRYADTLAAVPGVEVVTSDLSFPPPRALLDLASARLAAGESPEEPASVVPLYMREADATSNFERATRS